MNTTSETSQPKGWVNILKFIIPYFFVVGTFQLIGAKVIGIDIMKTELSSLGAKELMIIELFTLAGTWLIVWLFRKYVDKRSFKSLGFYTKSSGNQLLWGGLMGVVIISFAFLTLCITKQIVFLQYSFNTTELLLNIVLFICVGVSEELVMRGYVLSNLMDSYNKYLALFISSLLFSMMHIPNNNVSLVGLLSIFVSGILLGLPVLITKKLWFSIALHFTWNYFQGPIFGFNVSGFKTQSLISFRIPKANVWNGGKFGFEGSFLSIVLMIIAIALVWWFFRKDLEETV